MGKKIKITPPEGWEIDKEKSSLETGEVFYKEVNQKTWPVVLTEDGVKLFVGDTVVIVWGDISVKPTVLTDRFKVHPRAKFFASQEAAALYLEKIKGVRSKLRESIEFLILAQPRLNRDDFYDIFGQFAGHIWEKFSSRSHHLLDLYALLDETNKDTLLTFLTNKKYEAESDQNQAPQEA